MTVISDHRPKLKFWSDYVPGDFKRMDPGLKERWLKDLRSGNYAQVTGGLRKRNEEGEIRYCCIGVLCNEISHRKGWTSGGENVPGSTYFNWRGMYGMSLNFDELEKFIDPKAAAFLAARNDGLVHAVEMEGTGWTFNQIADWVEEML